MQLEGVWFTICVKFVKRLLSCTRKCKSGEYVERYLNTTICMYLYIMILKCNLYVALYTRKRYHHDIKIAAGFHFYVHL